MVRKNKGIEHSKHIISATNMAIGPGAQVYIDDRTKGIAESGPNKERTEEPIDLSPRNIRTLLDSVLPLGSDWDAFLIDCFPDVRRKIAVGMDRTAQYNILIELHSLSEIYQRLRGVLPGQF